MIDSRFSTVICAPAFPRRGGLATHVEVEIDEGLEHSSSIRCDALVSMAKARVGHDRLTRLDEALAIAVALG